MKKRLFLLFIVCHLSLSLAEAQRTMCNVPLTSVQWTGGFWGERFGVLSKTSVQSMWQTWQSKEGKGFNNFLVAAGEAKGEHHGPPFHDGDMYKWLEAVASVYAVTHDAELDAIMDRFIGLVQKSQRSDGYIHTPVIIKERNTVQSGATQLQQTGQGPVGTAVGKKDDKEKILLSSSRQFGAYWIGEWNIRVISAFLSDSTTKERIVVV